MLSGEQQQQQQHHAAVVVVVVVVAVAASFCYCCQVNKQDAMRRHVSQVSLSFALVFLFCLLLFFCLLFLFVVFVVVVAVVAVVAAVAVAAVIAVANNNFQTWLEQTCEWRRTHVMKMEITDAADSMEKVAYSECMNSKALQFGR